MRVLTATEMCDKILRRIEALTEAGKSLEAALTAAARAEHEYRKAKALAYPKTTGTVAERQYQLDEKCSEEREEKLMKSALAIAARELIRAETAKLNALQSVNATLRSEHRLAGRDGRT